ncbi:DUF2637 domain-containing protein [Rhodococcus hoagii]|nr:DUF2637 domain-containing protein [Prescottella equi]
MICLASFILSFVALADLLHMTGQPRELSYLFPVIIDGTILQATISICGSPGTTIAGRSGGSSGPSWPSLPASASQATPSMHGSLTRPISTHCSLRRSRPFRRSRCSQPATA